MEFWIACNQMGQADANEPPPDGGNIVKTARSARRALAWATAAALLLGAAGPAGAHHSFAMFDNDHQAKLEGTVTHFQWTNPHVYIELETLAADGAAKKWTIECANPGILNRVGWKFNMIKVGDKLKTVVAPLRD